MTKRNNMLQETTEKPWSNYVTEWIRNSDYYERIVDYRIEGDVVLFILCDGTILELYPDTEHTEE